MKIAVIVPTIRPESWELFLRHGTTYFINTKFAFFKVDDSGLIPHVQDWDFATNELGGNTKQFEWLSISRIVAETLVFAAKKWGADIFISLDDDIYPIGDPIQDHIDALNMEVSPRWMSTAQDWRVRGIPVGGENGLLYFHTAFGKGCLILMHQRSSLTQMKDIAFNKTNIPEGVLFPLCAMNFAFRRELLPWVYQVRWGNGWQSLVY